jgi:predicted LPLAT superfamily acyltransferase
MPTGPDAHRQSADARRQSADARAQGAAAAANDAEWLTRRERGNPRLLAAMAWLSLRLGRPLSRAALYPIVLYFFLFARASRRSELRYLRLALGREPTGRDRFRHLLYFASVIHDRVFLVNDREAPFQISVEGIDVIRARLASGKGAFLMGAHMGSFEVVGTIGKRQPGLRIVMAMYERNARKIAATLAALNPSARPDVIALGSLDAMLQIAARLEAGSCVGVLADRTRGTEPMQDVHLLGEPASLPTGPMRTAAVLGCEVIFMIGLYRGRNRYHVVFAPIADFSAVAAGGRAAAVHAGIERYAALLQQYCRSDPHNWFNFYDFWPARAARPRA